MPKCKLSIYSGQGVARAETSWDTQSILVFSEEYAQGDYLLLETDTPDCFWDVRLDDSMLPAILLLKGTALRLDIPLGQQKISYSPKSFSGNCHMIFATAARDDIAHARRNLALNPYDASYADGCFPHASANVETRGEAVFAARNTIDGIFANTSHGAYPYQSWGINRDPDAAIKIDLGTLCRVDEVRLTLRADFPHDNYWVRANLDFSDDSSETLRLEKTALPQVFCFKEKRVRWVALNQLIKSNELSPFPALTQIEVWGRIEPD